VYVSPFGDDASNGCDYRQPKRTIQSAIERVKSWRAVAHVIRACEGEYKGPFVIDHSVSLEGGYTCDWFSRPPAYAWPNFGGPRTVLTTAYGDDKTVVAVAWADGVRLDGLDVIATTGSFAIDLGATTNAVVRDCRVLGGGSSWPSAGIQVGYQTSASIVHDRVDGGHGFASSDHQRSSVGVWVRANAGAVRVEESDISGGRGNSVGSWDHGPAGIVVESGPTLVRGNRVRGGAGAGGGQDVSTGIAIDHASSVQVVGNRVDSGTAYCQGPSWCQSEAIDVVDSHDVTIDANRVYGGDWEIPALFGANGVDVLRSHDVQVTNNFVHGGNRANKSLFFINAVNVQSSQRVVVAHNTVFSGHAELGTALFVLNTLDASVMDNLLMAADNATNANVAACGTTTLADFAGNALVGGRGVATSLPIQGCTYGNPERVPAAILARLAQNFGLSPSHATNNELFDASCAVADCVVVPGCVDADTCRSGLFGPTASLDDGVADLFGSGWVPALTSPCELQTKGVDTTQWVSHDAFSQPRSKPPTVGALEYRGACR